MAEAAKAKAEAMMEGERQKVEAIKRRQKREIDRVIENEGNMALLQARIIKGENEEEEKKKEHEKNVLEKKKEEIKKKYAYQIEKQKEMEELFIEELLINR